MDEKTTREKLMDDRHKIWKWKVKGMRLMNEIDERLAALPDDPPTYTPGVWSDWSGGERPLALETDVEVELRAGGKIHIGAGKLRWNYLNGIDNSSDIVRFRIVPEADDAQASRVCPNCGGGGGGHDSVPTCHVCGGSGEVPDADPIRDIDEAANPIVPTPDAVVEARLVAADVGARHVTFSIGIDVFERGLIVIGETYTLARAVEAMDE